MKSRLKDLPFLTSCQILDKLVSSKARDILHHVRNNKPNGADNVLNKMLKYGAFNILNCLEKKCLISAWSLSIIMV